MQKSLRILEIGTAFGHMTVNLSEWSVDEAKIFTMGIVDDQPPACPMQQRGEITTRGQSGQHANHFGKGHKVTSILADSLSYDFKQLAPLDLVFIDGAHDLEHVLNDSLKTYEALSLNGYLTWHDFNSTTPWVEVRQALEQTNFDETIYYVIGTQVAFLQKA